jgi:hypothetical protein
MAYRYTDTNKWHDAWFLSLKPNEKLLFNYLCDNCDIAGFIEVVPKQWASDINCTISTIQDALKGLDRGLVFSKHGDCAYLRTFLKHQKNLPLNEINKCHLGIIKRFDIYKHKFEIENISEFIEGGLKGLKWGYGIGNGIGNGNSLKEESIKLNGNKDFIDKLIESFAEKYEKVRGLEYHIVHREKERSAAGKILSVYKKKWPEATSDMAIDSLSNYFESCLMITDNWLNQNMSLPIIINKFNEINSILKNGNKQRKTGAGATDAQIAEQFAKHFASDYKQ